uniref:LYR motif containing 1 n=1 Tax=Equus asinus TaxID=9793 RepID=A0A9L0JWH5_EQUAS
MTTATRQEVLGLYRRIFRLARKWQAASRQMEDTIKEKQYIVNEARMLFQKNKNVLVQLVSGSASSEDPLTQVTQVRPMRIFRGGAVPYALGLLPTTPTGAVHPFPFLEALEPYAV